MYYFFVLVLILFPDVVFAIDFNEDPSVGQFADDIGLIFFQALRGILLDSVYGRFCIGLSMFAVFVHMGRMYLSQRDKGLEDTVKFVLTNGLLIMMILYFSVPQFYVHAIRSYALFTFAIGDSIQLAMIGTKDLSAAPEYLRKIASGVEFDTVPFIFTLMQEIGMWIAVGIFYIITYLMVALAYFNTLFANFYIYILAVVGPLCIPLMLIPKLDKIFDGWINGLITAFFYYFFVKVILSLSVMILALAYIGKEGYFQIIGTGAVSFNPAVIVVTSAIDFVKPMLFFFVAFMTMIFIRSIVVGMVGQAGLSGVTGGLTGAALLRGVRR